MSLEGPSEAVPATAAVRCGYCVKEGVDPSAKFCPYCGYPQLGTEEERSAFAVERTRRQLREQASAEHVRKARNALFWVAGLNMIPYVIMGTAALIITGLVISLLFVGLALWTKYKPYPAILTALALYLLIIAASAIEDPLNLVKGIFLKVIVLSALVYALRSLKQDVPNEGPK